LERNPLAHQQRRQDTLADIELRFLLCCPTKQLLQARKNDPLQLLWESLAVQHQAQLQQSQCPRLAQSTLIPSGDEV
jgi:hypothetical protein